MLGRRGGLINLYVFLVDAVMLYLSYQLAHLIYLKTMGTHATNSTESVILMYLALFVIAVFFNTNSAFLKRDRTEEFQSVLKMDAVYLLALVLIIFVTRSYESISRIVTFTTLGLFFVFDYFARLLLKYILNSRNGAVKNRIMLVADRETAEQFISRVNHDEDNSRDISAVVLTDADGGIEMIEDIPVVSDFEGMFEYAKTDVVDEVVLSAADLTPQETARCINEFESMGIIVHIALQEFEDIGDYTRTASVIGNYPMITFSQTVQDAEKLVVKRFIDILAGIVGTIITGILTVFLAPAIYIESKGPIFFKQKRVGRNGRFFYMYKFRSMYPDAEKHKAELMEQNEMQGLMFKVTDDPRVTKVGRFIRKTSLDEFPQFFNILLGDMSLIGTRPPTVDEFRQYEEHHKRRLSMKPGLTGMWQVSGRSDITDFEEVVRLDCYYIDNWSLALDVKIFMKTVFAVFRRKGSK